MTKTKISIKMGFRFSCLIVLGDFDNKILLYHQRRKRMYELPIVCPLSLSVIYKIGPTTFLVILISTTGLYLFVIKS